jgi:hypothetical protein
LATNGALFLFASIAFHCFSVTNGFKRYRLLRIYPPLFEAPVVP